MTRITTLTNPLLLGFEEMERLIEKISKSGSDGYPPYNIEKITTQDDVSLRITLAVAGFREDELLVEVENNQLVIRGKQQADDGKDYLHRGIAARQFQKNFVLAEGIKVEEAELKSGLLSINLRRPEPQIANRTIKITAKD
ncbi:MAG: Hsp20 family protein [Nitratireductor sp.]